MRRNSSSEMGLNIDHIDQIAARTSMIEEEDRRVKIVAYEKSADLKIIIVDSLKKLINAGNELNFDSAKKFIELLFAKTEISKNFEIGIESYIGPREDKVPAWFESVTDELCIKVEPSFKNTQHVGYRVVIFFERKRY